MPDLSVHTSSGKLDIVATVTDRNAHREIMARAEYRFEALAGLCMRVLDNKRD